MRALGLGGLIAVVLATGCSPEDAPFHGQEVSWRPCHDGEEDAAGGGADTEWLESLECGTVTVPLDHGEPRGRTLDIALVRAPADGPKEEHLGSLVVNPGGPGVSGVRALESPLFGDGIRAAFDLVSFDPRGVGKSGGFACGDRYALVDARQSVAGTDPGDLGAAELRPLADAARGYARACEERVGEEFLARVGTVNVARDLDVIRDALGEERLNFVGYSYGAWIGALYAHMYPENIRALVLDGAVATRMSNAEAAVDQVAAFQHTWEMFLADCVAEVDACPFTGADRGSGGPGAASEADARMAGLLERLDRDPARVEGIPVDGRTLLTMVGMALYQEGAWDHLAGVLTALAEGDDRGVERHLGRLYDDTFGQYAKAESGESEPGTGHQDAGAAYTAVRCADRADPEDVTAYRDAADEAADISPLFGPGPVWDQLPCAYWPETEKAPTALTAPEAPPIVVVGTVGDPATPYHWVREAAERLETATLVTYEGAGHTVYGWGRSPCVDGAVDAYLLTGEVPRPGLTCPPAVT
ncbi:pimeloyl-ACP methyl ester carboxylesterase [Nocardiopsis arvandica]|uniref:Pimeloyl-ACP methyl ester carboxylesterase n=1 Tax=Nocardiopsis sinuspersici TaxID=501010 RepID=A0A7Z0BIT3_9ACTN|nr:pimeloyl-ACP methyl ester carboxylesterase [Nocardiopsis sinuspersici]